MVVVDGADKLREGAKVELDHARSAQAGAGARAAARRPKRGPRGERPPGERPRRRKSDGEAAPTAPRRAEPERDESVTPVHPAAGRDHAADGRDPARRHRRVSRAAAVRAARGRLPDDPGGHALSGREPRRDDLVDHRAARAPVRADAGLEPDVVDELGRRVGDHAAVQPRSSRSTSPSRRCRRRSTRRQLPADRPAEPADLQQGQSRRHADPHARAHVEDAAAAEARGPGRHARSRRRSRSCPAWVSSASAAASGPRCASRSIRRRSPRTACRSTTCARRSPTPTPTRRRAASTARRAPRPSTPTTS